MLLMRSGFSSREKCQLTLAKHMTKSSQDLDHRLCPVLSIDDDDATEDTVAIEAKGAWKTQPTEIRLQ